MPADRNGLIKRERAEMERRKNDVSLTQCADLRVATRIFERYLSPPADTPFAIEYAYNLLGDVRGKRVLDLGCGNGENTILLVNRGANVCGIDVSSSLIELARRRMEVNGFVEGFNFFTGSAHELPFPDASFDVVFGMASLYQRDLELASREVWRVLRSGGYGIFKEPVRNSKFLWLVRRLIPYRASKASPSNRPLTDQELERFTGRFNQYHSRAYQLPFVNVARRFSVVDGFAPLFYQLDNALLRRARWLQWYASVRVIKVVK
ncbi:MAG: class I SAM-dependent methyltransferase [Blastocatellales bacterium]